jgi:hypothetical protein
MAIQDIPGIISSVGSDPKKRITLIIILVCMIIMLCITQWSSRGDCDPLIAQNTQLLGIQKMLTEQNQSIIQKNRELSDGYIQIQEMLTKIKPDTVYIKVTETVAPIAMAQVENHFEVNDTIVQVSHKLIPSIVETHSKVVSRTSHSLKAIQNLKSFVKDKCEN